ncbi:MAG: hypothetical protein M0Z66_07395 [Thermaerobacter sp.]|nr:hypothetical protein [Thermaerobacter sp.]
MKGAHRPPEERRHPDRGPEAGVPTGKDVPERRGERSADQEE